MKALVVVTGRGIGGDAGLGLNLIKALEDFGVSCELVLDSNAPGLLFKKKGYSWHKIRIPQAGGHAATKITTIKAAISMIKSSFEIRSLIKKNKPDFVLGVNGGGAIVGCFGAKITRTPAVGAISTPLDTLCTKLNPCIVFPESPLFRKNNLPNHIHTSFFPIDSKIIMGNKENALKNLRKFENFDESKRTILFSSGSSLFKKMVQGIAEFSKISNDYNLLLVGIPLKEEYLDLIDQNNVIYLGYVHWLNDLFDYIDLAILTDDGLMLQEAICCKIPTIALTRVKFGRYHNMESIFKGAVIESDLNQLEDNIAKAFANFDEMKERCNFYAEKILKAKENIAKIILSEIS